MTAPEAPTTPGGNEGGSSTPPSGTPATPPAAPENPPWGSSEEFNPEKAWKLIQDLKEDKKKLSGREVLTPEQKQQLDEYQQWKQASQTELERANSELSRWQTEAQTWRQSAQSSRIQALAAEFADPSDAVTALGERNYLTAGGELDDAAITADLAEILERKPHWRRPTEPTAPPTPRAPAPNRNQGSGGGAPPVNDPREEFAAQLRAALTK